MIAIEMKFPTGKLHATPWGRHVNEGAVEWPPSPWRFLRALLAVWHHKFHDVTEEEMRALIATLSITPSYQLPVTSNGHTRHYMPAEHDKKTKIFDTFITVSPDDPLVIYWPDVELSDTQKTLLTQLVEALSYFGRSESWVIARLLSEYDGTINATPLNGHGVQKHQELVRLLAPTSQSEHEQWRVKMLKDIQQRELKAKQDTELKKKENGKKFIPFDKVKLTPKDIKKLESTLPETVFDALHAETSDLRKAGWNRPPASEWIDYVCDKQMTSSSKPKRMIQKKELPNVARYAIAGSVRPRLTEALWIGERVRTSLLKISDAAPVFLGRQRGSDEKALAQGHLHAHYLCESNNDPQGRITHITIYAPQGFSESDENTLNQFNRTWGKGGHDLQYVLLGLGQPEDFGGLDERKGQSPILACSDTWISRTPFVPADRLRRAYQLLDPKERHRCELDLARMIRKELQRRDWISEHLQKLVKIEATLSPETAGTHLGGIHTTWLKFKRNRQKGGGRQGHSSGFGLKLSFSEPVRGPIILGYGCHFGLGQFLPE